jgi:hypothetical protein
MTVRLTAPEVAALARRHPVTVRLALEDGSLHGTQRVKGGRWSVREDCAEAWADGLRCEHQKAVDDKNVTRMRARSA